MADLAKYIVLGSFVAIIIGPFFVYLYFKFFEEKKVDREVDNMFRTIKQRS